MAHMAPPAAYAIFGRRKNVRLTLAFDFDTNGPELDFGVGAGFFGSQQARHTCIRSACIPSARGQA